MYGDPAALMRMADQISAGADDLRADGRSVVSAAQSTRWVSTAADIHRQHMADTARSLDVLADRLDQAADDLRAHARQVAAVIAEIARVEQDVRRFFSDAVGLLERGVSVVAGTALHAASSAYHEVTSGFGLWGGGGDSDPTPPWQGWPWSPDHLPLPGSRDWLDLGDLARGAGFIG